MKDEADPKRFGGLVLCKMDDFEENGRLKPGYRDEDGCWVRYGKSDGNA